MAIQSVSFGNEPQQKRSNPLATVGLVAGAGTGFFMKDEIGAAKFLDKYTKATDEFKLSKEPKDKLTEPQTDAIKNLKEAVAGHKKIEESLTAKVAETFADEAKTEATPEEFAKYKGYENVADINTKLDAAKGETEALKATADAEKQAFNNLAKDATAEVKNEAKAKLDAANLAVENNKKAIAKHQANATVIKDGKGISKEAFTKIVKEDLKGGAIETVSENLKPLKGLLEKVTSYKKVAIFAAIGLAAGAIIGKMIAPKAEASEA